MPEKCHPNSLKLRGYILYIIIFLWLRHIFVFFFDEYEPRTRSSTFKLALTVLQKPPFHPYSLEENKYLIITSWEKKQEDEMFSYSALFPDLSPTRTPTDSFTVWETGNPWKQKSIDGLWGIKSVKDLVGQDPRNGLNKFALISYWYSLQTYRVLIIGVFLN